MKIIVDELPKVPEDCLFAEYISMTNKYKCMFRHGMYSRCDIDPEGECPYLKEKYPIFEFEVTGGEDNEA